ncbi:hypothetical protein Tsubulata_040711 [Turnera subulata]|uniref:Uncharacterized protein n=1 Tax=Turnera subulata TaxID=218843 RepID=A0A9Q0JS56_9ROSI|nr:hypothetical protein Tsubulata_040711 [Turnera subulata]
MNLPKPTLLVGDNYSITLNQSIENLLTQIRKGDPNFPHFTNTFYELMQSQIDPPLETIWVYSALSFHSRKTTKDDASSRFSTAKELFQLVSGVSASCSASRSVALLAPVVFELYSPVVELLGKDLGVKRVKKVIEKVKSLVGEILGYVSICCCKDLGVETDSNSTVPFADLVSVWTGGKGEIEAFLPLVGGEICREIGFGLCSVNYLAGVVIAEVFLLKMCLDLWVGSQGVGKEKDVRSSAVGLMTAFRSFYFFETLVRMLLEPTLRLSSLVSSGDEVLLRKILYDAVISVEYTYVSPERTTHLPSEHVTTLAMERLILTHEAIECFRKDGDHERAISCTSAFSTSRLPSQIVKFVKSQISKGEGVDNINGSSPKALLKWLLVQESKGNRLFDDRIAKRLARLPLDDFKTNYEHQVSKLESKRADVDLLPYIDRDGEEDNREEVEKEANESMISAFVAAAHSMRLTETGGRKRKQHRNDGNHRRNKLSKHDHDDSSDSETERSSSVSNDDLSSESEVENPSSDEDV